MDFNKIMKRALYKWLLWICIGLIFTETVYQFYLRSKWVEGTYYNWEDYASERNRYRIKYLANYFRQYKDKYFLYSQNPNEGNLEELPKEVQAIIINLKNDLISGIDLMSNHKHFEINFKKIGTGQYIIYVHSGATFKASYNGYNFDAIITNADSSYYKGYEMTHVTNVFVNKQYNKEYRSTPFILRYNCNSYDLLILKFFR